MLYIEIIKEYSGLLILLSILVGVVVSLVNIAGRRRDVRSDMRRAWKNLTAPEGSDNPHELFIVCLTADKKYPGFLKRIGCPDRESLQQAACISALQRITFLSLRFNNTLKRTIITPDLPIVSRVHLEERRDDVIGKLKGDIELIASYTI